LGEWKGRNVPKNVGGLCFCEPEQVARKFSQGDFSNHSISNLYLKPGGPAVKGFKNFPKSVHKDEKAQLKSRKIQRQSHSVSKRNQGKTQTSKQESITRQGVVEIPGLERGKKGYKNSIQTSLPLQRCE